jgi:DNA polymerase I
MDYFKQEVEVFRVENHSGFIKPGNKAALRYRDMEIRGFGLEPITFTEKGMPQADANVIRKLAGKNPSEGEYGDAYTQMEKRGKAEEGK